MLHPNEILESTEATHNANITAAVKSFHQNTNIFVPLQKLKTNGLPPCCFQNKCFLCFYVKTLGELFHTQFIF